MILADGSREDSLLPLAEVPHLANGGDAAVISLLAAVAAGKPVDLQALVAQGQSWQVEKEPRVE